MNTQKLIELFSKNRLEGYKSEKEHEQNLSLISQISHKLGILEIIIRNRIDKVMSTKDKEWLFALLADIVLDDDNGKIKEHNALVSRQTFGFWVKVAQQYKIHSCAFNEEFLESLNFKKYFSRNHKKLNKSPLANYQKAYALLLLIRNIRNRAFHFENLLKILPDGRPRLSAKVTFTKSYGVFSVMPDMIVIFLDDILKSFDENLIKYAKNGEKSPPEIKQDYS